MDVKLDSALLSLYVYKTASGKSSDVQEQQESLNKPNLDLINYEEIEYREDSAFHGFSYGVFRHKETGQVVIAYTGTNETYWKDFLLSNFLAGAGLITGQLLYAAEVYARVCNGLITDSVGSPISDASGSNVVFAGHSMGGGLAG